ncbi:MAG: MarR family transcriptional regulator [Alphaproteobacteria bacterium]|nr:MarR family transcriptional regulator [Alphaproteobacteria bacterium]
MQKKEFLTLIENHLRIVDWLSTRTRDDLEFMGYSKLYLRTLVRLHLYGKTMLKEFAKRNDMPSSNLCMMLKHLEKDGLVLRQIDDSDRRNTWYSLTPAGINLTRTVIDEFHRRIIELFSGLNKADETRLIIALRTVNELMNKIKNPHN